MSNIYYHHNSIFSRTIKNFMLKFIAEKPNLPRAHLHLLILTSKDHPRRAPKHQLIPGIILCVRPGVRVLCNSAAWGKACDDRPPQALTLYTPHQVGKNWPDRKLRRGGEPNTFMLVHQAHASTCGVLASKLMLGEIIKPHQNVIGLGMRASWKGRSDIMSVPKLRLPHNSVQERREVHPLGEAVKVSH
jgi:hypothetical protein